MINSVPRTSGVYKITCTANGRFYIGSSNDIRKRWNGHKRDLRKNKHHNGHLQNAWNKYGEQAFLFEIIELVESPLLDREQYWFNKLKPFGKQGFNANRIADKPPSQKGKTKTAITRARMSASAKGHSRNKGIRKTLEHRVKISEANKGKHQVGHKSIPETNEKLRIAKLGNTWNIGRKRSPEAVERGAEKRRKMYIVISPDGIEQTIKGLAKFCREQELDIVGMCAVLSGKQKHHRGWKCRPV